MALLHSLQTGSLNHLFSKLNTMCVHPTQNTQNTMCVHPTPNTMFVHPAQNTMCVQPTQNTLGVQPTQFTMGIHPKQDAPCLGNFQTNQSQQNAQISEQSDWWIISQSIPSLKRRSTVLNLQHSLHKPCIQNENVDWSHIYNKRRGFRQSRGKYKGNNVYTTLVGNLLNCFIEFAILH